MQAFENKPDNSGASSGGCRNLRISEGMDRQKCSEMDSPGPRNSIGIQLVTPCLPNSVTPRDTPYEKKGLTSGPEQGYFQICRLTPGALSPPRVILPDTETGPASQLEECLFVRELVCTFKAKGCPETRSGRRERFVRKTEKKVDRKRLLARLSFHSLPGLFFPNLLWAPHAGSAVVL